MLLDWEANKRGAYEGLQEIFWGYSANDIYLSSGDHPLQFLLFLGIETVEFKIKSDLSFIFSPL